MTTGPDEDEIDEIEAHRWLCSALSKPGEPLDPRGPNATLSNPDWFVRTGAGAEYLVLPTREDVWDRIIPVPAGTVPVERHACLFAGPPGAGKTYVREQLLRLSPGGWEIIDPDVIKVDLLREAIADGSYETYLKPDLIRGFEAEGHRFRPLELAALVHEESSLIAKLQRAEAIAAGRNIVVDTVLGSRDTASGFVQDLVAAGYSLDIIDVEVPEELSLLRIRQRWREQTEESDSDPDGLGGRWVPSDFPHDLYDRSTVPGRAVSQEMARVSGARYRRFWTPGADADAVIEVDTGA
ncbi:zeta toxin family protein [Tsukamurella soli]|uniref:UDP-N-acetylglucosamine kinase n=1 Tax=Tsukamurella soli TaxID=644556 RepID=A0ABP8J6I5_9ACTN